MSIDLGNSTNTPRLLHRDNCSSGDGLLRFANLLFKRGESIFGGSGGVIAPVGGQNSIIILGAVGQCG